MNRTILLIVTGLALLGGCGKGGLGPDADADVGERALQTALEAWKGGKTQDDLQMGSPSIIMNEDDWRTGKRLLNFKVEERAMSGRQVKRKVTITLQDKDGKTEDRKATYIIDTTPRIVIVRDTFAS
ncbi:MAG: hypothetical protein ACJ8F7_19695 [Gemmataceae bacterium]